MCDNFQELVKRAAKKFASYALAGSLMFMPVAPAAAGQAPKTSGQAAKKAPGKSFSKNALPKNDARLAALDSIVELAVAKDEIPGAVLLVGQRGRTLWRKAYGSRAILPRREAMTADTIFDLASLTKIFATTASIMKLLEAGKIRLNDPVVRFIP
ncbi:MAG: serine hydrolase domain-containing protein, partial [Bryobacteraceae bacterium]